MSLATSIISMYVDVKEFMSILFHEKVFPNRLEKDVRF